MSSQNHDPQQGSEDDGHAKRIKFKKVEPGWIQRLSYKGLEDAAQLPSNNSSLPVVGLIVTLSTGQTYDDLFESTPQFVPDGRVLVYKVTCGLILEFIIAVLRDDMNLVVANLNLYPPMDENDPAAESYIGYIPGRLGLQKIMPVTNRGFDYNKFLVDVLRDLHKHIRTLPPECVTFNFECCSGFERGTFGHDVRLDDLYFELIGCIVREYGGLAIFSDYSLKALIKQWSRRELSRALGPCPFIEVGKCENAIHLSFNPQKLAECDLRQLNTLGRLCSIREDEKGRLRYNKHAKIEIAAKGETLLFTLTAEAAKIMAVTKPQREKRKYFEKKLLQRQLSLRELAVYDKHIKGQIGKPYEINVLSLASYFGSSDFTKEKMSEISSDRLARLCMLEMEYGLAGHVTLTYPPATKYQNLNEKPCGRILATCAHWIGLTRIQVPLEQLLEVVAQDYGEQSPEYDDCFKDFEEISSPTRRAKKAEELAIKLIQRTPPNAPMPTPIQM